MPTTWDDILRGTGLALEEPPKQQDDPWASILAEVDGILPSETPQPPINSGLAFQQAGMVLRGDVQLPQRPAAEQQHDPAMLQMARSYLDEQAAYREGRGLVSGGSKVGGDFSSTFRGIPESRRPEFLQTLEYAASERVPDQAFDPVGAISEGVKQVVGMPQNAARAMGMLSPEETAALEFYNQAEGIRRGTAKAEQPRFAPDDSIVDKAGKLGREGLLGALEMAPAMYAGGNVGRAAGGAAGMLGANATRAAAVGTGAGTAFWSAQEFPDLYDSAREMGVDEGKARVAAVIAAPLVGYVEHLQFGQMEAPLKKMFKEKAQQSALKYAADVAKELGKTYVQEVTEENLQNGIGVAMRGALAAMDEDITLNGSEELKQAYATNRQAMLSMPFLLAPGGAVQAAGGAASMMQDRAANAERLKKDDSRQSAIERAVQQMREQAGTRQPVDIATEARKWAESHDNPDAVAKVAVLADSETVSRGAFEEAVGGPLRIGDRKLTQDERGAFAKAVKDRLQEGANNVGPEQSGRVESVNDDAVSNASEVSNVADSGSGVVGPADTGVPGRPDTGGGRAPEHGGTGVGGLGERSPAEVEQAWRATVPGAAQVKFAPGKSEMLRQIQESQGVTDERPVDGTDAGPVGRQPVHAEPTTEGGERPVPGQLPPDTGPETSVVTEVAGESVHKQHPVDERRTNSPGEAEAPPSDREPGDPQPQATDDAELDAAFDQGLDKVFGERPPKPGVAEPSDAVGSTTQQPSASKATEVQQPKPGMLKRPATIKTTSGRDIPAPPMIRIGEGNRKVTNDLKKIDQWLIDQAVAEATARGDEFNLLQFKNEKANNLPPASKSAMSLYLFDDPYAEFDAKTGEQIKQKPADAVGTSQAGELVDVTRGAEQQGTAPAPKSRPGILKRPEPPVVAPSVDSGSTKEGTRHDAEVREPWQMTREEYLEGKTDVDAKAIANSAHANHVKNAVATGQPVPANVLEGYKSNVWAKTALDSITPPKSKFTAKRNPEAPNATTDTGSEQVSSPQTTEAVQPVVETETEATKKPAILKRVGTRGQTAIPGLEVEAEVMEQLEADDIRFRPVLEQIAEASDSDVAETYREPLRRMRETILARINRYDDADTDAVHGLLNVPEVPRLETETYSQWARRDRAAQDIVKEAIRRERDTVVGSLTKGGGYKVGDPVRDTWHDKEGTIAGFGVSEDGVLFPRVRVDDAMTTESNFDDLERVQKPQETATDDADLDKAFDEGLEAVFGADTEPEYKPSKAEKANRPKKLTPLRTKEALRAYFTPGAIVESYAGLDKVIDFKDGLDTGATWEATVRAVDKDGNFLEGYDGRERKHGTLPAEKKLIDAWMSLPKKESKLRQKTKAKVAEVKDEMQDVLDRWKKKASDISKGTKLSSGFDPELVGLTVELVETAIKQKVYQFADFVVMVRDTIGEDLVREHRRYIEGGWNAVGRRPEFSGIVDKAGKVEDVLNENGRPQRDDSGDAAARPENLEEESSEADGLDDASGEGSSDTSGSGVVAGDADTTQGGGDVPPGSTKHGAKGVRGSSRSGRGGNYRLGANERVGGTKSFAAKARYKENIAAIQLLKKLQEEGREATTKEQAELVKYVGWGGLKQVFGKGKKVGKETIFGPIKGWESEFKQLRELLTDDEWKAAKGSTKNAHYTDPRVIGAMWDGLTAAGFQGGRIVEPATGSGLFFGMLPASIASNPATRLIGTEIDPLSGGIAKQLYQDANIQVQGFEQANIPDNSVDLFISNVPFGSYQLSDRHDKSVKKASIHDFFFNKAIQKTRPGGLVAFITSRYTMDAKDASNRKYWQQSGADVVGVIRLPGSAFKGMANTDVVTDIVILQKRDPGVEPSGTPWVHRKDVPKQGYLELVAKAGGGKHKVRQSGSTTFPVNEYFAKHPEHIVGELAWTGTMQRTTENQLNVESVEGVDIAERVKEIIASLPFDKERLDRVNEMSETMDNAARDAIADGTWKDDHLRIEGDRIYVNDFGTKREVAVPYGRHKKNDDGEYTEISAASPKSIKRTQGLIDVFNAAEELIALQPSTEATDKEIETARAKLNDEYDRFVGEYGPLSQGWNNTFGTNMSITVGSRLLSLEEYNPDTGVAKKAAIFTERTERPRTFPTSATTPVDALSISLSQRGRLDTEHVANLIGRSVDEVMEELGDLVFVNHSGAWELAATYLSGDVRAKLAEAQKLSEKDPNYKRNVAALEAVQPEDLNPSQIAVRLGSPWIPGEQYQQFLDHLLRRNVTVRHVKSNGKWLVTPESRNGNKQLEELDWGTSDIPALEIITKHLNNGDLTVRRPDGAGGTYIDRDATTTVQAKLTAIKSEFERWLFDDGARSDAMVDLYNTTINNIHTEPVDGSHLTFPGMSEHVRSLLDAHQVNAVWRYLTGGNMLLAHVVGAGKSFVMAAAAMEQKRISGNPSFKTMIAVPNHLVTSGQFASELLQAYPSAKILAATPDSLSGIGRRSLLKKMATGNYDIVVIAHSSFGMIPLNPTFENDFIQKQIDDLESEVRTAKAESDRSYETELESQLANLRDRLNVMKNAVVKDTRTTFFDELGIDSLFVDEAHEFKNLAFRTRMSRVPGVNPDGSGKAFDMWMKTTYYNGVTGESNLMFATGTPIANAIAEMYTMMRYLQPKALQRLGLEHFDSWAAAFADKVTAPEIDPAGGGMRMNTRLAQYINMPELATLFRQTTDVQTAAMLKDVLQRPKVKGGEARAVLAERNAILEEIIEGLQERAQRVRSGAVDKSTDNMLSIVTDGRKAATDIRLIDPSYPDLKGSKVNLAIAEIHKIWKDTADEKLTQLVWLDVTSPDTKGPFNLYREIVDKLAAKGIPREQIAVMHDYNEKTKAQLFRAMNVGEIRILLGSTAVMGTGVNVQKLLIANHHLDVPWRPDQLEQRDGRILRRGNTNDEVGIVRYISKGSFDAFMWDKIEQKAKFINAAISGTSGRTLDASEAEDMSAAEMKAAAADDPNLMNYVKTKAEVERLESERRGFLDQMSQTRRAIVTAQSDIERHNRQEKEYKEVVAKQEEAQAKIPEKEIRGEVGGTKYTKPVEFGEALLLALADAPRSSKYESEAVDFTYNGLVGAAYIRFNTVADFKPGDPSNDLNIYARIGDGRNTNNSLSLSESATGNITRLNNAIDTMKNQPEYHRLEAEKAKDKIPGLEKRLDKKWPGEEELSKQRQEFTRLAALVQQSGGDAHKTAIAERIAKLHGGKISVNTLTGGYTHTDESGEEKPVPQRFIDTAEGQLQSERNAQREERLKKLRDQAEVYDWDRTINPAPPSKRRGRATKQADDRGDIVESSGFFGGGVMRTKKRQGLILPADVQSSNPKAEAAIQRAHGVGKASLLGKLKDFGHAFKTAFRVYEFIPNNSKKFGVFVDVIRRAKEVQSHAQDEAGRIVAAMVDELEPDAYAVFERAVVLENLKASVEAGEPLRYEYDSLDEIKDDLKRVNKVIDANPAIQRALATRKQEVRELVEQLVEHDLLPEAALERTEAYYHQMVLTYARANRFGGGGRGMTQHKKAFQKRRVQGPDRLGPEYDYNSNYVESEVTWMTDAIASLRIEELLTNIKENYDTRKQKTAEAKRTNYLTLVGGPANAKRIEELKELMKTDIRGDERAAVKEELSDLDPTYQYRIDIAVAANRLAELEPDLFRGADPYDVDDSNHRFWDEVRRLAHDYSEPSQKAATGFLAAVGAKERMMKETLGDKFQTWETLVGEDEAVWTPQPNNIFYPAYTVPEQIVEQFQQGVITEFNLTEDQLRQVFIMGGVRGQMVLPVEIVQQLERMEKAKPSDVVKTGASAIMARWKEWMLHAPHKIVGYSLRNITGDVDAAVAGAPGIAKYVTPKLYQELRGYYSHRALNFSDDLRAARDHAVLDAGMDVQEITDLHKNEAFRRLMEAAEGTGSKLDPLELVAWYRSKASELSRTREGVLRYAAFKYFKDQLNAGSLKNYGASKIEVVDEIHNKLGVDAAAAKLARDLLGDYGNITIMGDWLRSTGISPFWSFQELNLRRYPRLMMNAWQGNNRKGVAVSGAIKAAVAASRIAWVYALMALWNMLKWPEEEDELAEYYRANPHIIFGKAPNGNTLVLNNTGALGDVLEWAGLNSMPQHAKRFLAGKMDAKDIGSEMFTDLLNKLYSSAGPAKSLVEVPMGMNAFPDVLRPRQEDRDKLLANAVGVTREYEFVKGKVLGSGDSVDDTYWIRWSGLSSISPQKNALSTVHAARRRYSESIGKPDSDSIYAVSKYRTILKSAENGDYEAFKRSRQKLLKEGKGYDEVVELFMKRLEGIDPTARLANKDMDGFLEFLTQKEREQLDVARRHAQDMRLLLWQWWETASREEDTKDQRQAYDAWSQKYLYELWQTGYGETKAGKPYGEPIPGPTDTHETYRDRYGKWVAKRKEAQDTLTKRQGMLKRISK